MTGNIKQSSSKVNTPDQRQLITAAVYGFLVHGGILPDLPLRTANAIASHWGIDHSIIEKLPVCGYPGEVANICICAAASARFGDALANVPGFYKQQVTDEAGTYDFWRMDLNPKWSDCGFIVPQVHHRHGFYTGLLAFRHPRDLRPFTVVVRGDGERKQKAA